MPCSRVGLSLETGPRERGSCYSPGPAPSSAGLGQGRAPPFFAPRPGSRSAPRSAQPPGSSGNAKIVGHHHPKPVVAVAVVRIVPVAVGAADVPLIIVERPAAHHPVVLPARPRTSGTHGIARYVPRRLLDPATQQAADLGDHARHVSVLSRRQPAPAGGQPQVDAHPLQRLVGPLQSLRRAWPWRRLASSSRSRRSKAASSRRRVKVCRCARGKWLVMGSSQSSKSKVRVKITISSRQP